MAQWLVGVNGVDADLELVSQELTMTDMQIIKQDEGYFLSSPTFDALADDRLVRQEAAQVLPFINAGTHLRIAGFQPLSLGHVLFIADDGRKHIHVAAHAALRLRVRAALTLTGAQGQPQPPPFIAWAVKLGQSDAMVAEACTYFTKEHTWVNLYKVWEAIRDDQGGREQGRGRQIVTGKGWVTDEDWCRFDDSANAHSLSGEGARHRDVKPRHNLPAMSLQEAERFIGTLMMHWLEAKAAAAGM